MSLSNPQHHQSNRNTPSDRFSKFFADFVSLLPFLATNSVPTFAKSNENDKRPRVLPTLEKKLKMIDSEAGK
jgi:hypothetical protein